MDELCIPPAADQHTTTAIETWSSPKEEAATRRATRYTQAEQALTESLHSSQNELATPQLQIDALLKAAYLIQTRIADARESLEKLQALLNDRAMEPQLYQSLQRERWLEERRLLAAEEFSKVLKRALSTVPFSATQPQTPRCGPSNANPNVNFARFFEHSRRRALIRGPNCRQFWADKADGSTSCSRIHCHNTLLPLLLPTQRRQFRPTKFPLPPQHPPPSNREGSRCSSYSSSSAKSSFLPEPPPITGESSVSIMPTTSIPAVSPPPPRSTDVDGIATIWRQSSMLSREEILKDLVVSMPDYVGDLLAEFDSVVPSAPQTLLKTNHAPVATPDSLISSPPKTQNNFPSSHSETSTSSIGSSTLPNGHKSTKRRHSVMFSFPDALSSRTSIRSRDDPTPSKSRSAWRFSSPPSSFPSNFDQNSPTTMNEPARQTHSMPKRSSISISDLRSVFTTSPPSTVPTVPSIPVNGSAPSPRPPKEGGEEKLFARLKRRMSVLRRF